jgi:phage shock protein A
MRSAFNDELRLQRQRAQHQLESAQRVGDSFLADAVLARIDELEELAAHHGEDVVT